MRKGWVYKHENNTDVAVEVLRIVYVPEKRGYKVKVSFLNIVNPKNIYPCGLVEEIFIPAYCMRKWRSYGRHHNVQIG